MQKPDWKFWSAMPEVELWQAVALSLDLDPDAIDPDSIGYESQQLDKHGWRGDTPLPKETLVEFSKRLRLLYGNLVSKGSFSRFEKEFFDPHLSKVRLNEFAVWCFQKDIQIPTALFVIGDPAESKPEGETLAQTYSAPAILDGEPPLQPDKNSREKVKAWVTWQANKLKSPDDIGTTLAEKIRLLAEKRGYKSERRALSIGTIVKMLPVGITGGHEKKRRKLNK
jgi:hypothetical protein